MGQSQPSSRATKAKNYNIKAHGRYKVWCKKDSGEEVIEEYNFLLDRGFSIATYEEMYMNRTHEPGVVQVYSLEHSSGGPCSYPRGSLLIERIPRRLNQGALLVYSMVPPVLEKVLQAYKALHKIYSEFRVRPSMIGVNNHDEIKVWHNIDLSLPMPEHPGGSINSMIESIISSVEECAEQPQEFPRFTQFYQTTLQEKTPSFETVLDLLKKYQLSSRPIIKAQDSNRIAHKTQKYSSRFNNQQPSQSSVEPERFASIRATEPAAPLQNPENRVIRESPLPYIAKKSRHPYESKSETQEKRSKYPEGNIRLTESRIPKNRQHFGPSHISCEGKNYQVSHISVSAPPGKDNQGELLWRQQRYVEAPAVLYIPQRHQQDPRMPPDIFKVRKGKSAIQRNDSHARDAKIVFENNSPRIVLKNARSKEQSNEFTLF